MCSLFHLHRNRGWELFHEDKFEEAIAEWRVTADLDRKPAGHDTNRQCYLCAAGN